MHPLFALLATRPQLLVDHAQAYAALFCAEFSLARAQWRKVVILQAVALFFFAAATVLAGVALMLWAVTPVVQIHTPWLLFVTPLLPLGAAIACQLAARKHNQSNAFTNLSQQISADIALLRAVAPP
ncbi:hypothetical protein GALL_449160 [mine drainage metagenome]|uniref:Uncharacterized protein n=1 Tax=mine drainage metagenome TaxID=410659 RepID=A0A1J5PRN0_9ZZZZ